jgi:hypothetical protein
MISFTKSGYVGLLPAAMSLAACEQEYSVAVTSERGQVTFTVPDSAPHCLERLTVYAASDRANPIWLIDAPSQRSCTVQVRYGVIPGGFEQRGPMTVLTPGKLYVVSVSRTGAKGQSFFEPGRDGSIEKKSSS